MSDLVITALIAGFATGIPALILAIATLRSSRENGRNSQANAVKTQAAVNFVDSKTDALRETASEIKTQTNGPLKEMSASIGRLTVEVAALKALLNPPHNKSPRSK